MFCFVDFIWGRGCFFRGGGGIALFKRFRMLKIYSTFVNSFIHHIRLLKPNFHDVA